MNALTKIQAQPRTTFTAWRILPGDKLAHDCAIRSATLPAIEAEIAVAGHFGATILLLEQDAVTDASVLHVYRIRRGRWVGAFDVLGRKLFPHVADRLFALPVDAFAPTEPWKWAPGCDVVGAGDGVIDGRVAELGDGR